MKRTHLAVVLVLGLALALGMTAACSSQGDTSDTDIQASVVMTSDVVKIDITVHDLKTGALLYYSGKQDVDPDLFPGHMALERNVKLPASTDLLFDANAYGADGALLDVGMQVQKATQAPGVATQVLIVIPLNSGQNGGNNSPTEIVAVTDNIPVLEPPNIDNLPARGIHMTMRYAATDADWPADADETMTFFTTILYGDVIPDPGQSDLFAQGQTYGFTFNDDLPVALLVGVVDRFHQAGFAEVVMDPETGAFEVTEQTEGYALLLDDGGGTVLPRPIQHSDATTQPPVAPGSLMMAVVRHGDLGKSETEQVITRNDDATQVTPANEAFWFPGKGSIISFNKYELPHGAAEIPKYVYKMRIRLLSSGAVTAPSQVNDITDTMTYGPTDTREWAFLTQAEEEIAGVPFSVMTPVVDQGPAPAAHFLPGDTITFAGSALSGLSIVYFTNDATGAQTFASAISESSAPDKDTVTAQLPATLPGGSYHATFITFGRLAATYAAALAVDDPIVATRSAR